MVLPMLWGSASSSMTRRELALSRLPVGSSATIILGSLISARAMAALCVWPPLSWLGRKYSRFWIPTRSSIWLASFSRLVRVCLLYTSDAADDLLCVDLGGRRIIKKKKKHI